jgi:hypothetical protein
VNLTSINSLYIQNNLVTLGPVWKSNDKFWEEIIAYFPLIRHGPHRKRLLQQFFVAAGTYLPSCYLEAIGRYTDPQTTRPTILLLLRVFIAAGTCLLSRCLATKGGIHFTEPLPSNDSRVIHRHTLMAGIYEVRR